MIKVYNLAKTYNLYSIYISIFFPDWIGSTFQPWIPKMDMDRSGTYPILSAISRTVFFVFALMSGASLKARETVWTAKPLISAIVLSVGRALECLVESVFETWVFFECSMRHFFPRLHLSAIVFFSVSVHSEAFISKNICT